jgi:hypothetical protein
MPVGAELVLVGALALIVLGALARNGWLLAAGVIFGASFLTSYRSARRHRQHR